MKRFHLLLIFCAFFFHSVAQSGAVISGSVINASSREPLAGASIQLFSSSSRVVAVTISDDNGSFFMGNLAAGKYKLKVTFIGFEENVSDVTLEAGIAQHPLVVMKQLTRVSEEVFVRSTRIRRGIAGAYTNLSAADIRKGNFGQDMPFLLNLTPSTVVNSDAGAGIGYTGLRIRGSDATRTNVTINGIPLNDPESHGVFWVNLPDLASSANSIQVQRGVGTSANGAAAFGASINIETRQVSQKPYAQADYTFGSFNTSKYTVSAGTGLMDNHWSFDVRGSMIKSDGFIDRAASNLTSAFLTATHLGARSVLKINTFTGKEKTYQAWNGIPEARYKGDRDGMIKYGSDFGLSQQDLDFMLSSGSRTYNSFTYKNQTDNYQQDHYQAFYSYDITNRLKVNGGLHYTYGRGYYEEYRADEKFSKYKLNDVIIGSDTLTTSNFVRRRWLDNDFYGAIGSLIYTFSKTTLIAGGGVNEYKGRHFGEIIWAQYASNGAPGDHFYDGRSTKKEWSAYLKADTKLGKGFTFFADLQTRVISYKLHGEDLDGSSYRPYNFSLNYNFFNPKAGINYQVNKASQVYVYAGVANREPVRSDIIQASSSSVPRPEHMVDFEGGYKLALNRLALEINLFHMQYRNQLVNTGRINDVGAYNRVNVAKSFRRGVELSAGYRILPKLNWQVTASVSENKIVKFDEYLDNWDLGTQDIVSHRNTPIAFSPSFIGSSQLSYTPVTNFEMALISKYVSRQYLDNTGNKGRSLDPFFVSDVRLRYTHAVRNFFKSVSGSVLVANLFNVAYVPNGATYSALYNGVRNDYNFYYPQAGRNFLVHLSFVF